MKAFSFRLEQALRWRETQVNLQKSHVTAAAGRLAEIEAMLEAERSALTNATARLLDQPTGDMLKSYAAFKEKSAERIRECEAQALAARQTLALEMNRLVEANQKLRLLENLRQKGLRNWHKEFDRELAAFADEAFVQRIRAHDEGARSSPG